LDRRRKRRKRDGAAPTAPTQNLKIPHGQLLVFTEQLAHLLQAGMTLDEGLSVLEKRLKQATRPANDAQRCIRRWSMAAVFHKH